MHIVAECIWLAKQPFIFFKKTMPQPNWQNMRLGIFYRSKPFRSCLNDSTLSLNLSRMGYLSSCSSLLNLCISPTCEHFWRNWKLEICTWRKLSSCFIPTTHMDMYSYTYTCACTCIHTDASCYSSITGSCLYWEYINGY